MERISGFLNQKKVLVLLLFSLVMSTGLNAYLFFGIIRSSEEGKSGGETSNWIRGVGNRMWSAFSIRLTPNKAVLSYYRDSHFNVTVKGLYWAPYDFGPRPFYFKIYREIIQYDESPKIVGERTVVVNKSREEMHYKILFNFTVTWDLGGMHLYTIVGHKVPDFTLTSGGCEATFTVNIM